MRGARFSGYSLSLAEKIGMCLTIPKKVISIKNGVIRVVPINGKMIEEAGSIIKVKKGDWVITQNSIIINKITSRQAKEVCKIFNN